MSTIMPQSWAVSPQSEAFSSTTQLNSGAGVSSYGSWWPIPRIKGVAA
jgi:hypothetical protein